jgi:hypothetical protein
VTGRPAVTTYRMNTPVLEQLREDVRAALEASVPHPARLSRPDEFGRAACQILEDPYLNGETVQPDGATRMSPR